MSALVDIKILLLPKGVKQGCKVCRKIMNDGTGLLEVTINSEAPGVILIDPPLECCGEVKKFFVTFPNHDAGYALAQQFMERIKTEGYEFLKLIPITDVPGYPKSRIGLN